MNKIISTTFTVLFVVSYLSPSIWSAIDTTRSGRILDNFKSQQEEILFESSPVDIADASSVLEQEYAMNGLQSLKTRLKLIETAYTAKKNEITEIRVTLEEALKNLDESIVSTEQSLNQATIDIYLKKQKIQQLRSDGLILKGKIREHRKVILSYLANIYSEWNTILDETGNIDLIKGMILSDKDTDFSLSDMDSQN